MAYSVVVTVDGLDHVIAVVDRIANPDWANLLELLGQTIEEQTIHHFSLQAGPEGPWVERSSGGWWPLLVKTGRLRGSITHVVQLPDEVAIGTNVYYGKFHQLGTRTIPRRQFLGITDQDKDEIQTVMNNYFEWLIRWETGEG